jgi:MoxR-like ATPase
MSLKSKVRIVKAALFTPLSDGKWGLPLLLWGEPGPGKSAVVGQIARACGLPIKVLPPGQVGEGMFGVVPYPVQTEKGVRLTYPAPAWVDDLAEGGLAFPDETNTAPMALQAAIMGLIHDRRVGDYVLPPRVRVLGAANPTACSAGGNDLSAPMANRLGHIDWPHPSTEEWANFMRSGGTVENYLDGDVDPLTEEKRVMAAWAVAYSEAVGLVTAFHERRSGLLHKMPAAGDPQQSRAWPSHRSNEFATRALASAKVHGLTEAETDEFFAAFVGQAVATQFAAWRVALDLPDPSAVLDGTVTWTHDPKRLDRTAAVLGACTTLVVPLDAAKRKARAAKLWKILADVMATDKDLVVMQVRVLVGRKIGLVGMPEARPVTEGLAPLLRAGGYLS